MGLARGSHWGLVPKGNGSRPSRFNRAGIRSDALQVVFLGGFETPVGRLAPCYLRDLGSYSVIYRVAQHQQQGRPALANSNNSNQSSL